MPRTPQTLEEWQEAVDAAAFALALDASHQYGLIERVSEDGAPLEGSGVDTDRAIDLLEQARAVGIEPRPLEQILADA